MRIQARPALSIICLILLLAATASAQTPATISGSVTTRADAASVPGAKVSLVGSTVSATTDDQGRYTIEVPPALAKAGRVQLRVEALGQPPKTYDVELATNAPTTFDIALSLGFEQQVTVGSRMGGAEVEKAVPVDIITSEQISSSGYAETAQVIQSLAPSFNFPRPTITDGTDTVRPATLRGLGPDQVLVLINGTALSDELDKGGWRVVADPQVGRGGCKVDTASNQIDAQAAARWARLNQSLGKNLEWLA